MGKIVTLIMYKTVLKVAFVAAVALVSGINVFNAQKSETLSEIAAANVEALAAVKPDGLGCTLSLFDICETANGDHPLYRNKKPDE